MTGKQNSDSDRRMCWRCQGLGEIKSRSWNLSWECPACDGDGAVRQVDTDTTQTDGE